MEAFSFLFQKHDLYNSIMFQMGEMMYVNFLAQDEAVFNPERFKEKVLSMMLAEFSDIQSEIKPYPIVADWLVKLIAAKSTDQWMASKLYCRSLQPPILFTPQGCLYV